MPVQKGGRGTDPGADLERRVGRTEFNDGALVRLRVPIRVDADSGRDVLTDIDVLAVDVDGRLRPIPDHAVQFAKHLMSTTHESVLERVGFEHTLIDTVEGGGPEIVVPPWAVQQFAAIGTPAELIERIAAAHAAGADSWSCSFTGTPQETAASMTRFAEQVMKPLRSHMAA